MSLSKLADFPCIMECMNLIEMDNSGPRARALNPERMVPTDWLTDFLVAERALERIKDKVIKEVVPEADWPKFELIDEVPFNGCFNVLGAGEYTEQRELMRAAGFTDDETGSIDNVLGEFFDGELTGVFTCQRS